MPATPLPVATPALLTDEEAAVWRSEASVTDLARLYHLLLGRDAEPHVLLRPPGRAVQDIAREMAFSDELRDQVLQAVVELQPVPHSRLPDRQLSGLDRWLTDRLSCPPWPPLAGATGTGRPQGERSAGEEAKAPTPALILSRAYAHPVLAEWLSKAHGSLYTQALEELDRQRQAGQRQLEGKIEFVNREYISGWALDAAGGPERLQVEIRHQGRLVATAGAHSYRPDIHQRFGGEGLAGFRAKWSPSELPSASTMDLTLHVAGTDVVLGAPYRFKNHFVDQLSVAQLLAKELEEIQRRLDVLAGMVPQALSFSAFPVEHYDLYRRVHRVPPPPWLRERHDAGHQPPCSPAPQLLLRALVQGGQGATPLRQTIDSLRAQAGQADGRLRLLLAVVGGDAEARAATSMLAAADPRIVALDDWGRAQAWLVASAAREGEPEWALLVNAGEVLDTHAVAWLAQAQADVSQAVVLYWDEDRLLNAEGQAPMREPRHVDPLFRDPFDAEALLELNGVGQSLAIRRDTLMQALAQLADCVPVPADAAAQEDTAAPWPGPVAELRSSTSLSRSGDDVHALSPRRREWLLWALLRQGELAHLPHPLLSQVGRPGEAPEDAEHRLARMLARATPDSLRPLLPAAWKDRLWRRVRDPVCPNLSKPLIRWSPADPGAKLAVIIPTRDYIHLVRDCVSSLLRHALRPAALDIIVVDNGSVEPETAEYLLEAERAGQLRSLRVDEPFNWSRLNNLAAAATPAQHLLFLNNDTLMLTPEWDDILRGLLERPDVGAVGARLLYEDMTIQHAGILFGVERFAAHEGVGEQPDASDAPLRTQLSRTVRGVTGAFLACRRDTFERVGPFDEQQLTVAYNDVEWCLRLGDKAPELAIIYAPLLSLIHLESKSRGFDFQDLSKQRRADYERQCLDRAATGALLRASRQDASVHSAWARPRRTLR